MIRTRGHRRYDGGEVRSRHDVEDQPVEADEGSLVLRYVKVKSVEQSEHQWQEKDPHQHVLEAVDGKVEGRGEESPGGQVELKYFKTARFF